MNNLSLLIPLVKIDVERRLVIARAAQEVPDKAKEIMDYETAKPAFQRWSDDFSARSGGLSKGNVRVMHQKSSVAGKVTEMTFNDAEKAIDVVMKIVDPVDWQKCVEGVYTGVSVGGGYAKKWDDNGLTRYTPIINEISLVDNPCIPTATIVELVKADGGVEQMQLRGRVRSFAELWTPPAAPPASFAQAWAPMRKAAGSAFSEDEHPRDEKGRFSPGAIDYLKAGAALVGTGVAGYHFGRIKGHHEVADGTVQPMRNKSKAGAEADGLMHRAHVAALAASSQKHAAAIARARGDHGAARTHEAKAAHLTAYANAQAETVAKMKAVAGHIDPQQVGEEVINKVRDHVTRYSKDRDYAVQVTQAIKKFVSKPSSLTFDQHTSASNIIRAALHAAHKR